MGDATWKQWERDVAAALGGHRSGPTGNTTPDVSGVVLLSPECKYQATLSFKEADWQQACRNASPGTWPALFLKERGGKRMRVQMDFADFSKLFAIVREHLAIPTHHPTLKP